MAYNWKSGGAGAMSGAAAGSAFGPWGAGIGGALGGLSGLFGDDPADAANKYYNQIPGAMKPYYQPYVDAGNWSLGKLKEQYGDMMGDPAGIISKIGQGYKESPGFQNRLHQGQTAMGNANSAGGMAGTQQHMQQSGKLAEDMAGEDFNNYMGQALGLYNQGVQGTQGMANTGFNASSGLADSIGQVLMSQGNIAGGGAADRNQQFGKSLGNFGDNFGRYGNKGQNDNWWWGK